MPVTSVEWRSTRGGTRGTMTRSAWEEWRWDTYCLVKIVIQNWLENVNKQYFYLLIIISYFFWGGRGLWTAIRIYKQLSLNWVKKGLYKVKASSNCLVHATAHFLGFLAPLSLAVYSAWAQVMKWRMSLIRKHLDSTLCNFFLSAPHPYCSSVPKKYVIFQ